MVDPALEALRRGEVVQWKEAIDPSTYQIYYYNQTTGQTQWERPVEMGPAPHATGKRSVMKMTVMVMMITLTAAAAAAADNACASEIKEDVRGCMLVDVNVSLISISADVRVCVCVFSPIFPSHCRVVW